MGILIAGQCGFAHNRLSLIDLSPAGNQPMVLDEYILVYNGELYNFQPLREELIAAGRTFIGTSDTEVLLHALIVYGVEATLKRIRGMFAFSFYDVRRNQLYLCRDRYGIKPLHFTVQPQGVYWASEIKALRTVVPLEIDPIQAYFSIASHAEIPREVTLFRNVRNVEAGTFITIDGDGSARKTQYYEMLDAVDQTVYREMDALSIAEASARLGHILDDSVRRMLIADAPMGIFLSGGIDSSLLTALAVRHSRDFQLFTSNVIGRHTEFPDAQLVAAHVGMPLYDSRFEPDDLLRYWAHCTWHYEVPIVRHTNAMAMSRVAALTREHSVKAVLTGEGADEIFYGYPRLLTQRYDQIVNLPINAVKRVYNLFPPLRRYVLPNPEDQIDAFIGLHTQRYERQIAREQARERYSFLSDAQFKEHYLVVQNLKENILSLLWRNDRMGMISSIEARFPFLDEDVVHFGINLPSKFKIGRSRRFHNIMHPFLIDKAIVRQVCEPLLPERITHKRKLGFPVFGHKDLKIRPGFFQDGYISELLHMQAATEDYLLRNQNPYFAAKLAALEVFGRLFQYNQSQDHITEHLQRFSRISAN